MVTRQQQIDAVVRLLKKKQTEGFWGKITLSLRSGDLTMTEVNQTIPTDQLVKPEPLSQ